MSDERAASRPDRWWLWMLLIWIAIAVGLIVWRWGRIYWFALGDTDDNMRLMQVRALLDGQGWYDLRQYRLSPPQGFNMHWSRLVDLPLAGLILALKPFLGTAWAERWAIGIAPTLPIGVILIGLGLTVRRLIAPLAWLLVPLLLLAGASLVGMVSPARVDHHGWQLAMLAVLIAGLADTKRRRGGITAGIATALSLVIGFEMMPYLALAGAATVARWVWDGAEAPRLGGYGAALALATSIGFALFISRDNLAPRCDALTPPWLLAMVTGGTLLILLARVTPTTRLARLGAAVAAGGVLGAVFALNSPQCLGRPEGVSPQLQSGWLDNIREARPIYVQEWRTAATLLSLPIAGLVGALAALWSARRDPARLAHWLPVAALAATAFGLLFYQIRAAAASQLLAIPGAIALIWLVVPPLRRSPSVFVRVFGVVLAILVATGWLVPLAIQAIPKTPEKASARAVGRAGASCATVPSMTPLNRIPPATILTMVDLGPRLITLTHHSAIAGPYHRNETQILDVHRAFKGTEVDARAVARKYSATLLMICPKFPETTVYRARSPNGFYAKLESGQVPNWLEAIPLPAGSPFRLWRIKR